MENASTAEEMNTEQDLIRRLYSAPHSLSCDDTDCPWAGLFNESSSAGASFRKDALLLVLLGIVDNMGECLDLIRILVASRKDTSSTTSRNSVASGTTSHSQSEGTSVGAHGPLHESPTPSLYHKQWTPSPAASPASYTSFCHSDLQGFPHVPTPSPATRGSDTTRSISETPIPENHKGASPGDQKEQH